MKISKAQAKALRWYSDNEQSYGDGRDYRFSNFRNVEQFLLKEGLIELGPTFQSP